MKTFQPLLMRALRCFRSHINNHVTHHDPTSENILGQSGLHTFIGDLQDVIEGLDGTLVEDHAQLNRSLFDFFMQGSDEKNQNPLSCTSNVRLEWELKMKDRRIHELEMEISGLRIENQIISDEQFGLSQELMEAQSDLN